MSSSLGMDIVGIAERFRDERESVGYNQAAAARALGVTRETLRNIENGQSDFKISLLLAASQLGMDAQFILSGVRSTNVAAVEKAVVQPPSLTVNGTVAGVGMAGAGAVVNITNTNKHTTKVVAQTTPGDEHISIEERAALKRLVDEVAETEARLRKMPKSHRAIWSALNAHCRVSSYHLIAKEDFEKARRYLHQWMGRLNAGKSAAVVNGEAWRKKRYAYIKINTKDPEDDAALMAYIKRNFHTDSLTELANDELEQTYRYVAGRRNRRR